MPGTSNQLHGVAIFTIAAALMSATVVALFGIRANAEEIVNPVASRPLRALNSTFSVSDWGRCGSPVDNSVRSQLSGFLYKAAYITGRKMKNNYEIGPPYLPEQGPLGHTIYGKLNTGGIGLNMSSYLQYSESPHGFSMPRKFEFNELRASVFSTHVSVSCQSTDVDIGHVRVMAVGKPDGSNITLFNGLQSYKYHQTLLIIGTAVTVDRCNQRADAYPRHPPFWHQARLRHGMHLQWPRVPCRRVCDLPSLAPANQRREALRSHSRSLREITVGELDAHHVGL
jgi:hypothetical protein